MDLWHCQTPYQATNFVFLSFFSPKLKPGLALFKAPSKLPNWFCGLFQTLPGARVEFVCLFQGFFQASERALWMFPDQMGLFGLSKPFPSSPKLALFAWWQDASFFFAFPKHKLGVCVFFGRLFQASRPPNWALWTFPDSLPGYQIGVFGLFQPLQCWFNLLKPRFARIASIFLSTFSGVCASVCLDLARCGAPLQEWKQQI